VRVAVAEALPGMSRANDAAAFCRELATTLVADAEVDVRIAICLQAATLSATLGIGFLSERLVPTLDQLLHDETIDERVELAAVLMGLAEPLGASVACSHLLPLMRMLLDDTNTNVRLAVINGLRPFILLVGSESDAGSAGAVTGEVGELGAMLSSLATDGNWRVRHATLLLLPTLATSAAFSAVSISRAPADFETWATDKCALIRSDWVRMCAEIAEVPGYSSAWLVQHVLPVLLRRHADTASYEKRAVLLHGMARLAPHLGVRPLEEELLPLALSMATDKVPNLRMLMAGTLQKAAHHLSHSIVIGRVMPALRDLETDQDVDVVEAARDATEACVALTTP